MGFFLGFNWLDLVVVFALLIGLVVGFAQGLLRQVILLATLYVGAVLGAQYYTLIAGLVRAFFPGPPSRSANAFGFFFILIAVVLIVNWLAYDAYHSTRLHLFPLIDHLGGSVLGFVTAAIILVITLPIITFAAGEPWPWAEATRLAVKDALVVSHLVPILDFFKPTLLNALTPWLPNGLPTLFNL